MGYGTVSEWLRRIFERIFLVCVQKPIDSDISYIPVDKETVTMKKGDFMVMYDLIPELVEKAWSVINADYSNKD